MKRRCFVGTFTPGTAATANFYNYVTASLNSAGTIATIPLTGLSNLTEYQALFDQFRINAIKWEFLPRIVDLNQNQTNASAGTTFQDRPYISYCVDKRGTTIPGGTYSSGTYNAFTEVGPVKMRRGDKPLSIYIKNPLIVEQFGGGATRYVTPKFADIDSSGIAMAHRGLYVFFHNQVFTSAAFVQYDVYCTYYVTFKGMK